jgi:hypothetical protein
LGKSKNRSDTSGGTDMGAPPIRELAAEVVENIREHEGLASAGRRNAGIDVGREDSCTNLRSECLTAGHDMISVLEVVLAKDF